MNEQINLSNAETQSWPGAFGIYKRSKEVIMVNISTFLGLLAIFIVSSIAAGIVLSIFGVGNNNVLRNIVDLFIGSAFTVAAVKVIMLGVQNQHSDFGDALKSCFSVTTLKMVGLTLLTLLICIGSLLLLVVPFFFVFPRIALAYYFLIDKNMGIVDSISASWNATRGSSGKVWGITGVSVLFVFAMLILIGIYLSIMYSAAYALLYVFLTTQQKSVSSNN